MGPFAVVPFLPPTSNKIYVTNWGNKSRFLSKEAQVFKTKAIASIQEQRLAEIGALAEVIKNDDRAIFSVNYVFFFEDSDILNTTFGQGKKGSAVTRYKRMDVENRVKLLTDSLVTAVGIDDSLFFQGSHAKCSAKLVGGKPQIHIYFGQAQPVEYGV